MERHYPNYSHCRYLDFAIETPKLRKSIALALKALKFFEFDAIAFRGMSGAMIAPILALRLKKTMIMVRKDPGNSHSGMYVEGDKAARRYVIVDDFVSCGITACEIITRVNAWASDAECIGVLQVRRLFERVKSTKNILTAHDTQFVYPTDSRLREAVSKCKWMKKDLEHSTSLQIRPSASLAIMNRACAAVAQ